MKSRSKSICYAIPFFILVLFSTFNITEVTSNNGEPYSIPSLSVDQEITWVITHYKDFPENIGLTRSVRIENITEEPTQWVIEYKWRYAGEENYDYYTFIDYILKSSPYSIPDLFCPIPVEDYLADYFSVNTPTGFSASDNRLIFYNGYNYDVIVFNKETGIVSSVTWRINGENGEIIYRWASSSPSKDTIPGYNIVLTIFFVTITLIGISSILLKKKL